VSDEPLTSEDYDSVLRAGRVLHEQGWRQSWTLNQQVDSWVGLVETVEDGYRMTIDDYTNDLSVRQWLELARPLLTERVRASLDGRLAPLDERFKAATRETAVKLPGAGPFWWSRLPKVLVDELAEDVQRMGLDRA
jgi:hypothetical protein